MRPLGTFMPDIDEEDDPPPVHAEKEIDSPKSKTISVFLFININDTSILK